MQGRTIINVMRAPEDSPAKYVTVSQSGQILNAWKKLSDISAYYRAIYGRNAGDKIELVRQLNKTWTPDKRKS